MDTRTLARLAALLWIGCGALVVAGSALMPAGEDFVRPGVLVVGFVAVIVGAVVWNLPWNRWHPAATLVLVPVAFTVIAAFNRLAADPWLYDTFFLVSFVWLGLAHRLGTSTACAPLLAIAYLVPLAGRGDDIRGPASLLFVLPVCVVLGESAAWAASRLRRAEQERAHSEARYASLVRHASEVVVVLDDAATFQYASPAAMRVLGFRPEELEGQPASAFVHPEDLAIVREWFATARDGALINRPLTYRYRHADGSWRWIEGTVSDLRHEPSVAGIVINGRDITERMEAEHQLAHLATHDPLTALPNRSAFLDDLRRALGRAERHEGGVGVLFLDIDEFKVVNDSLGHAVGDQLLVAVAGLLKSTVRSGDTLARLGGDEFTVVVEDLGDGTETVALAERILTALQEPTLIAGRKHVIGASIGIATSEGGIDEAEELLRRADLAMYRAKELGRHRFEVFDEALARRARRRLDIEAELRMAIERGELLCHYQPEVTLHDGRIVGMEALVRWHHPTRGLLAPAEFVDIAEKSDLVVGVGNVVLQHACRAAAGWLRRYGNAAPHVAVNVSARQLHDPGFIASVAEALRESNLPANMLRIELLESMLAGSGTDELLMELQRMGISVAIDDFGTGYSSLSYLDRLPVDVVKIDRSFLAPVTTGDDRAPVVEATIAVAKSLGLGVVAEGVETPAHVALLARLGCSRAQGFFFSRPVPTEEAGRLLASRLSNLATLPTP